MTTYQDQPLSRRAMREREAEAARAASTPADAPEGAAEATSSAAPTYTAPPEPLTYVTQGRTPLPQYDAPVASVEPAPEAPAADAASGGDEGFRYRDYSPDGRRAARLGWTAAPTESADLDYRTQGRADVPPVPPQQPVAPQPPVAEPDAASEAGLSRRELRALREAQDREAGILPPSDEPAGYASAPPVASAPPTYAASAPPAYTPFASAPPVAPAPAAAPEATPAPAVGPEWLAAFSPPSASTAAPVEQPTSAAFDDILIGETVDDADASDGPVVVAEQVREVPPPLIEPAAPATDALASFEALFRSDTGVTPAQSTPPAPTYSAPPAYTAPPAAPAPSYTAPPAPAYTAPPAPQAPTYSAPPVVTSPPAPYTPAAPVVATSPVEAPQFAAPEAPSAPAAAPLNLAFIPAPPAPEQVAPETPAEVPATTSQPPVAGERPRNHWSRQAELDDEAQPATGSLSRSVGGAPATASALVLPEIPSPDLMATPLTSTGDVLVTGSISLPASLSSTGALPTQLDESDLDHLLDPGDHQVASTDSQPVRAIRAVSTHTSSREIIGTIKPKRSNRALTALIISAAGMAVVVVALLVVAVASGVLG